MSVQRGNKKAETEQKEPVAPAAVEPAAPSAPAPVEPAPAPAAVEPAVAEPSASAIESAIAAETARCEGLHALAKQADRLGVTFDAGAAIRTKMSVADARAKVMDAAADGDAPDTSAVAVSKNKAAGLQPGQKTMSSEEVSSAWAKAIGGKRR